MTEREKALEEAARDVVRLRHHYEVRGAIDRLEAALSSTPPAESQAREAFTEAARRYAYTHEARDKGRMMIAYDAMIEAERAGEVGDGTD